MDFIREIENDTLLIIPNALKNKVLTYINSLNRLISIKIYNMEEIKKHIFFDYSIDAILYLMEQYHYKYEVSKTLIDNMYYIENKSYVSDKLNELVKLKKELFEHNLLKKDTLFKTFAANKKVIVYGYSYIDNFMKKMLSYFNDVTYMDEKKENNKEFTVYESVTVFDEVNFIFSKIATLIDKGIDINKIKITNVDDSYYHALRTLSKFYHIPIAIPSNDSLLGTTLGNGLITILNNSQSLEDAIDTFQQSYNNTTTIYNKIISICNKYIGLRTPFDIIKECIIYSLRKTKIDNKKLDKMIEIVPFSDNVFDPDEYVFLMNFNQGNSPVIYKDEDYISDNLKEELGLDNVNTINLLTKESWLKQIKNITNLTITYKLKSITEDFYPSNLIKDLNMQVEKIELDTTYTKVYSKIRLGSMLDELIKYDYINPKLDIYYNSVPISYMQYNNAFTGISPLSLAKKLDNKLLLSYSTIDNYYRCGFRYYISNILKLDKYEETFKTFVGNLFHYILSKALEDNFSFDTEWDNYIKDKPLLVSEQFFLIKLKEELKLIITEVKRLHQETGLTNHMLEKKIYIDKSHDNMNVTFMGIVDKIMYKNIDGSDLIAIIDYKTGNPNTNLFNTIYGIDMQLPVYLYLVKYSTLFSNPNFVGFYLQKILHGEINRSLNKTYKEQKQDNLKLVGYSTTDEGALARFDPTYQNSTFIKSMKISSKGFYSYAKVIEDEKIKLLISLVNSKIDEAIENITKAKFDINPKRIGQELTGCAFCKFHDLCYMREEDIVNLKEYQDFSFLGGEDNG